MDKLDLTLAIHYPRVVIAWTVFKWTVKWIFLLTMVAVLWHFKHYK